MHRLANFCILGLTWKRILFRSCVVICLLFVAESLPNFGSILVGNKLKKIAEKTPKLKLCRFICFGSRTFVIVFFDTSEVTLTPPPPETASATCKSK